MSIILGWLSSLGESLLTVALAWLAKFFAKKVEAAVEEAVDSRENQSIKEEIENAKTPEEKQAALNRAAEHLGNRP